jgi:beta-N-acetylhexosaminidase
MSKAPLIRRSLSLLVLCIWVNMPFLSALSFTDDENPAVLAAALLADMSDEEALAQVFMLAWEGGEPSPLILEWIQKRHIGGVKIFGWNTANTTTLARTVGRLQEASMNGPYGIPLLVATDQEGGMVRHVKGDTSVTPGNMAIGASGYPEDAYLSGYYIGKELRLLGVNMNFAPTIDLYTNRNSELIGTRTFGSDPAEAGVLGAAFAKGLARAGIIATAKHYPGHGDTALDSHGTLPRIDADFDTLWERELAPYRMLAKEGIPAVMSGHLAFPNTEAGDTPASLSSWFLQDILREQIGFKGIVVTDDLNMAGAINNTGSLSSVAKQALMAGNDVIMFSSTPGLDSSLWTRLNADMKTDTAFRARVRDAAYRVLETKLTWLRGEDAVPPVPDLEALASGLPDPEGSAFFLNLACRSVTLIREDANKNVFPLSAEKAGLVMLAGRNYPEFFEIGQFAFPGARNYWYSEERGGNDFLYFARQADTIIFNISEERDLAMLNYLRGLGKRVIIFSCMRPVEPDDVSWADGAFAVYSSSRESFIAGFSAILGRIPFQGRLP